MIIDMKKLIFTSLLLLCAAGLGAQTITVMSYNMRYGKAKDYGNSWEYRCQATPAMLKDQAPDVFGVQECYDLQAEFILKTCPKYKGYGIPRSQKSPERTEVFWNKWKFKALDMGTFWLSETPEVESKGWDGRHSRTATWVVLKMRKGGKKFIFVNTHLDHRGKEARRQGLALIEKKIAEINPGNLPWVLTGDFNIKDDNELILDFNKRMNNARLTAEDRRDDSNTFHGFGKYGDDGKRRVIDYIYYAGFSKCNVYETVRQSYAGVPYISDHYPIKAVVEF